MDNSKILIVDDEPDTLEMLTIAIERGPYEVATARNGEEALQMVEKEKPDLVILDVMMPPGIDGFEVCDILKNNPDTSEIFVILLTAVASSISPKYSTKLSKAEFQADGYIEKPADPNHLLHVVNTLLKKP